MFGAFVRVTDAGLGCPDWPGCYGKASPIGAMTQIREAAQALPDGPVTVFKAWVEMLHRYVAAGLGLIIIVLVVLAHCDARRRASIGLAWFTGLCGRDLRRWSLARRGWRAPHVVVARSEEEALERLLRFHPSLGVGDLKRSAA